MTCCLCSNPYAPHTEDRYSDERHRWQTWHFCSSCRQELKDQRQATDREVLERYRVFLRYVTRGFHHDLYHGPSGKRLSARR